MNPVRAVKRGGKNQFVSLDWEEGETRYRLEPVDFLTAERIYEARWAMTLLRNVLERMRRQCATQGKEAVFQNLRVFGQIGGPARVPSYEEIALKMKIGLPALKTLIHRMRKNAVIALVAYERIFQPSERPTSIQ